MGADKMKATAIGSVIELSRDQWDGHKAYISDYPGLLEAVQKYTWTYSGGEHPYLRSSKLKTSLHKFVLAFLYEADNLEKMLVLFRFCALLNQFLGRQLNVFQILISRL